MTSPNARPKRDLRGVVERLVAEEHDLPLQQRAADVGDGVGAERGGPMSTPWISAPVQPDSGRTSTSDAVGAGMGVDHKSVKLTDQVGITSMGPTSRPSGGAEVLATISPMVEPSPEPVRLQQPQAVLTPLTAAAIFLVVTIDAGGEDVVRDLLADLAGLERTVGFRAPDAGLALVTGIGSEAWDRLFAGPRPAELHPFVEIRGARHHAPSTPGDLLFHIRAAKLDLCFELASLIMDRLVDVVTVVDEVHGFKYFDDRDLLGFVDGTENPTAARRPRPSPSVARTPTSPGPAT